MDAHLPAGALPTAVLKVSRSLDSRAVLGLLARADARLGVDPPVNFRWRIADEATNLFEERSFTLHAPYAQRAGLDS